MLSLVVAPVSSLLDVDVGLLVSDTQMNDEKGHTAMHS
jgi:hypothetical protein